MQTTETTTTSYAPGEALTRHVSIREFVAHAAPGLYADLEDGGSWSELEDEGHAEAQRLGLPASPEGRYPMIVWDSAWSRQGF